MAFRPLIALGIVLASVLAALANFVSWPVAALLGVGSGVLTLIGTLWLQRRSSDPPLAALSERVREQWKNELQARGISLSAPLRVRWVSTNRDVSAPALNIVGNAVAGRPVRIRASGDLHDLAVKFQRLPRQQLVILGPPGAGKTVMAAFMALNLLSDGSRVPVVLSLSSWDPRRSLYDWAAHQLGRDYPEFGASATWRALLASGRLIPILDGLDEIPDAHRARALVEINTSTDGGNPFVLTCRVDEYEELVRNSSHVLASALVVELLPVTADEVISYLHRPAQGDRWSAFFAALRAGGPLLEVLSVPFMAALARFSYARPDTDPAELCAINDPREIRSLLLGSLLPAAYSKTPHPDLYLSHDSVYTADQATEWLSFIAQYMTRSGAVEFAWWRLHEMLTGWRQILLRILLPATSFGALAGNIVGAIVDIEIQSGVASMFCTVVGGFIGFLFPTRPRLPVWADPTVQKESIKVGAAASAVAFLLFGSVMALMLWLEVYSKPQIITHDLRFLTTLITIFIVVYLSIALGLLVSEMYVRTRLAARDLPDVGDLLGSDRQVFQRNIYVNVVLWSFCLIAYLTFFSDEFNLFSGFVFLVALGGVNARYASSTFWITTRLLRGRLPRSLILFLEDAHDRGILRKVGAVYQFRHVLLQQYLSGPMANIGSQL